MKRIVIPERGSRSTSRTAPAAPRQQPKPAPKPRPAPRPKPQPPQIEIRNVTAKIEVPVQVVASVTIKGSRDSEQNLCGASCLYLTPKGKFSAKNAVCQLFHAPLETDKATMLSVRCTSCNGLVQ